MPRLPGAHGRDGKGNFWLRFSKLRESIRGNGKRRKANLYSCAVLAPPGFDSWGWAACSAWQWLSALCVCRSRE